MTLYSGIEIESSTETVIIALLSKGNFSRVYLCKHIIPSKNLKSLYRAIKVYPRESSLLRSSRIISEKSVLQKIASSTCPYIARLLSTKKDDKYLYFILEAYQCGSLNFHIRKSSCGKFPAAIARNFAAEIVSALNCLNKCGCMHRDLKPANIIVDRAGHLKLSDFGASKIFFPQVDCDSIMNRDPIHCKKTFTIIGTMQYMAPEIIARSYGYFAEVDWWALGVVIYEMLCGVPPTFKNIPIWDNAIVMSAAQNGSWPDEETSSIAMTAIVAPQKSLEIEIVDFCEYKSTYSQLKSWTPILTDSHFATLFSSNLSRFGWDLIQKLLTPNPTRRLGPWSAGKIEDHPFFRSVEWDDVESGLSKAPDLDFDKTLGFQDLVDDSEHIIALEMSEGLNNNLFEGF